MAWVFLLTPKTAMPRLLRKTVVYEYADPEEHDSDYDPEKDEQPDSCDGESAIDTEDD